MQNDDTYLTIHQLGELFGYSTPSSTCAFVKNAPDFPPPVKSVIEPPSLRPARRWERKAIMAYKAIHDQKKKAKQGNKKPVATTPAQPKATLTELAFPFLTGQPINGAGRFGHDIRVADARHGHNPKSQIRVELRALPD